MTIYNGMLLLVEIIVLTFQILFGICKSCICETYKLFAKRKDVAGEIVLVTGAGHGIGEKLAIGYALLGATVICLDIKDKNNQRTKNKIKEMGKHAVYAYRCDVANREEVFTTAEKIKKEVGDVSILVNNAGVGYAKTLLNYTSEELDQTINVNFKGLCLMLRAYLPSMIEKNHGHIVAVSSLLAILPSHYSSVYSATKAAIKVIMANTNVDVYRTTNGKSLIKFTTVFPTVVLTGLIKNPIMRFPGIVNPLTPEKAASLIIDAHRRNCIEGSIPSYFLPLITIIRGGSPDYFDLVDICCQGHHHDLLPNEVQRYIRDFVGLTAIPDD